MSTQKVLGYSRTEWKASAAIFVVGTVAALAWFFTPSAPPKLPPTTQERMAAKGHPNARVSDTEALVTCQKALRSVARDPEKAEIPDVGAMQGGADWRFLWNPNSRVVRMQNGLGAQVAATAMCVVDEESGRIKLLTLDGKQLVAPEKAS